MEFYCTFIAGLTVKKARGGACVVLPHMASSPPHQPVAGDLVTTVLSVLSSDTEHNHDVGC